MLQRHGLYGVVEQICIHPREANQLHLYNVSIDGSKPNKMAIRLANTPTHEAIAQKVQAMNYIVAAYPAITSMHFNWTTKIGNTNLIKKLLPWSPQSTSTPTNEWKWPLTYSQPTRWASKKIMRSMAKKFQMSNQRMQGSSITLPPPPLKDIIVPAHMAQAPLCKKRLSSPNFKPLDFHNTHINIHQGHNISNA